MQSTAFLLLLIGERLTAIGAVATYFSIFKNK